MLNQEERCADVDGKKLIEFLNRRLVDRPWSRDTGIGNKYVKAITEDVSNLVCKDTRTFGNSHVTSNCLSLSSGCLNLSYDGFGFLCTSPIVNEHMGTRLSDSESARPPDAPRGPCHECSLTG